MASNVITNAIGVIFAQGLQALREACVMPRLVNSDYSTDAMQPGDTINIVIPSAGAAVAITPANVAPDAAAVSPTKATISLNNHYEAAFDLTDKEAAEIYNTPQYRNNQITEHIRALANKINETIFATAAGSYGYVGTAGTTPFASDVSAATQARKELNEQLAPLNPRRMVLNPEAEMSALGLRAFQDASFRADAAGIIEGQIGRKLGFDFFMDQQVPTHTSGTITTGLVAKTGTAQALGDKTIICTTAASTGACALLTGDIVTFASDPQTYVLTAAATQASAASDVTLNIEPGLKIALAGDEAVAVKASHVMNLAFHRDAIGFASRTLAGDGQMTDAERQNVLQLADPVSGLTLRLERRREHYRTRYSFSSLWGVSLVRREYITRVAG